MEKYILASFCNLPLTTVGPILCIKVQIDGHEPDGPMEFAPVALGYHGPIDTATGLCRKDGKVYIVFGAEGKAFISVLNEDGLEYLYCQEIPEAVEAHSILANEQYLYVVSTGTDQVLRYDLHADRVDHPCCVWEASQEHKDTHHINSILEIDGEVYISAFGPKAGQLWASATQGYIHNITKDQRVLEGIHHPHSLTVHDRQLYYCESRNGSFCSQGGPIFKLEGYSRGIVWLSDQMVAVTTSIGRKVSRSTGIFANPADPGEKAGVCSLNIKQADTGNTLISTDLSWFGPEIYDLLVLEAPIDLLQTTNRSYLAEREVLGAGLRSYRQSLIEMHSQHTVSQQAVQELTAKVGESQSIIQTLQAGLEERRREVQTLTDQSLDTQQANHILSAKLSEIECSKAWKAALWMRDIRVKLLPPKSYRENLIRWIYRAMHSYKKSP